MNQKPSLFAQMAILSAVSAGFTMAPARLDPRPIAPHEPTRAPLRDPNGPAPWLAPTLPPLDPPRKEREPKVKRRSKAERKQRRRARKQRAKR